jgi:hypothetical protein
MEKTIKASDLSGAKQDRVRKTKSKAKTRTSLLKFVKLTNLQQ